MTRVVVEWSFLGHQERADRRWVGSPRICGRPRNRRRPNRGLWQTFGEYLDFVPPDLGLNVGANVGHSSLRHYVIGVEAQEREATTYEIDEMCEHLGAGLAAGAFGLSSAYDNLTDERDVPVASSFASTDERIALARTVTAHGRCYYQATINSANPRIRAEQLKEMARVSMESGASCSALVILDSATGPGLWRKELDLLEELTAAAPASAPRRLLGRST
jgi:N-acyl-D-aspartate/D-glutamate deacylase